MKHENKKQDSEKVKDYLILSQNLISNKGSIYKDLMKSASAENLAISVNLPTYVFSNYQKDQFRNYLNETILVSTKE